MIGKSVVSLILRSDDEVSKETEVTDALLPRKASKL